MRLVGSMSALALLLAPHLATAQGVFRGPYLNDVSGDAVTVVWESPSPTTGVVRYGLTTLTQTAQDGTAATHHEVRLTGLSALAAPGSELRYELEVGGVTYPGRFRTMPPAGAPFRFFIYGDNRSSPEQHQQVVTALQAEPARPYFAINTGDLVSNGESEGDWDQFFPVAAPFLANTPYYLAIGNHEVSLGRFDVTRRLFVLPTSVPPASNDEAYYRVIYGNVELIVINVEVSSLYTLGFLQGAQEPWLEQVLADRLPGVQHRFLFLHQGPYSSKVGRNGNFWLRQWMDTLRSNEIDVIFSGHDHYAERGFTQTGIWYVIQGGGGAPLYDTLGPRVTNDHTIVYGESRLGYTLVEIDGPKAHITTKGLAGETVDELSYGDSAAPFCAAPADCGAAPTYACPGGQWECYRSACRWACASGSSSLLQCATDSACVTQIGANCAGTATCEHPSLNPLSWYCKCNLPPDCTIDQDCQGRPPPVAGCTGTWACVTEQCEFTTTLCMPLDGGVDAGAALDAQAADAAPGLDAQPPGDAAVPARPDAAGPVDSGGGGGASSGCGCSSTSPREGAGAILLLGALATRRRRRRTGSPPPAR